MQAPFDRDRAELSRSPINGSVRPSIVRDFRRCVSTLPSGGPVPSVPKLAKVLTGWLEERRDWPGGIGPALFLNQRGERLSVKAAHDIITGIADGAGLEDDITAHVLRHTFATTLVRGGTDLVIVAELLGHARLETTRGYTRPTTEDRVRALDLLAVDE